MAEVYYVYVHTRCDTGSVFYVGKGQAGRAWTKRRSNRHWLNIVSKTDYAVTIIQDCMQEDGAFLLEMWLIAKFRHEGIKLANKTDGGEGLSGFRHSYETRIKSARKVYCSNGMTFESISFAADWVRSQGVYAARGGMITSCCMGKRKTVYGYAWDYNSVPVTPEHTGKEAMAKAAAKASSVKVFCSNGMEFNSRKDAVIWLRENGHPNASDSAIVACCNGKYHTAYGHTWANSKKSLGSFMTKSDRSIARGGTEVMCSNGMIFNSLSSAQRWLRGNGKAKADAVNIKKHLDGKIKTAYGYTWSYP